MRRAISTVRSLILVLLITACATTQSRYVPLDQSYPPLPETHDIEVYRTGSPEKPYVKVSRLDVHLEKTHFLGSDFEDALPDLKRQARLSGAHAIIDVEERSSMVGETRIYHVTATGVRYTSSSQP